MIVELGLVEQRYAAVLEVFNDGAKVIDVAARYGVARQTVHEWLRRYGSGGAAGVGRSVLSAVVVPASDASTPPEGFEVSGRYRGQSVRRIPGLDK
jgi:transposase-like protein